jgi:hypothetical protein
MQRCVSRDQCTRDVSLHAVAEMQLEEGGNKKERRKRNKKGTQAATEPEQEGQHAGPVGVVECDANNTDGNIAEDGPEHVISRSEAVNEGKTAGAEESEADTDPRGKERKEKSGEKGVVEHPQGRTSSNKADKSGKPKHGSGPKHGKNSKKKRAGKAVNVGMGPRDKAFIEECKAEAQIGAENDDANIQSEACLSRQQRHTPKPQHAATKASWRIRQKAVAEKCDENEVPRRRAHVQHDDSNSPNGKQEAASKEHENQGSSTHLRAGVETNGDSDSVHEVESSITAPRDSVATLYASAVKAKMEEVVLNLKGKVGMAKLKRIKKAVKQAMTAPGQTLVQMQHKSDDGDEFG